MTSRRFPPDVYSGTETVFRSLYREARERHEVRLVVGWTTGRDRIPPEAIGVRLRGMSKPKQWLKMARAIRAEVKRWKPDVVLSNNLDLPPTGVPAVCVVHDLNFGEAPPDEPRPRAVGQWFKKAGYGTGSRLFRRVVTVSQSSARALTDAGVDPGRITVIRNGMDFNRFTVQPSGSIGDAVRFVCPSRIFPAKAQHLAIDAVARLPGIYKRRATLDVVGSCVDGVYLDQIRVQAYNQPVQFAVGVPDMVHHLHAADVVVVPTIMPEGFGLTATEAMACGKPVIWSDQPGIREATGGIGVAVPPGDVDALRAAMRRLMDSPGERAELGDAGRAFVEGSGDWSRVWDHYERILVTAAQ